MQSMDTVGVTFVNGLIGRGIQNNVVNLQFGTFVYSPAANGKEIDRDLRVSCRLRMDVLAAQELYLALGELLASISEQAAEIAPVPGEQAPAPTTEDAKKPN